MLARFITNQFWVRADQTIRPDAFIPPKDLNLSVTRHTGISEDLLWKIGQAVAEAVGSKRTACLAGRADIATKDVEREGLRVESAPLLENANHAQIVGWPEDKPARKHLAHCLAEAALFKAPPCLPALL